MTSRKQCPCEFPEVEPCSTQCSCRRPHMSGGCSRCCRYGSPEQQLAAAQRLAGQASLGDLINARATAGSRMWEAHRAYEEAPRDNRQAEHDRLDEAQRAYEHARNAEAAHEGQVIYDNVCKLLENPPPPTEALVRLMSTPAPPSTDLALALARLAAWEPVVRAACFGCIDHGPVWDAAYALQTQADHAPDRAEPWYTPRTCFFCEHVHVVGHETVPDGKCPECGCTWVIL